VGFSGESVDEDVGMTALRLAGLILGFLLLCLPLEIVVKAMFIYIYVKMLMYICTYLRQHFE
jgi:hypothetical protein